jgi:hypothetical protein
MRLSLLITAIALLPALALEACGGAPAAPAADVPGADSSAAPVDDSELDAPAAECAEGSPDCGK